MGDRQCAMWKTRPILACAFAAMILAAIGCQQPMNTPLHALSRGEYGRARMVLREHVVDDPDDRRYLLDRMRVGVLTLADGYPRSARHVFEEVYEVLRSQGINRDRTVQSIVLNEDVKIWKGEPFEQALAMAYYAMTMAELESWDNARAAADNALFYLRDFGEDADGDRLNTVQIARRSLLYERAVAAGADPDAALRKADRQMKGGYLDHGYVAVPSNFTLGYLLHGIASQQLGRVDEASDHFLQAARIDPSLEPLVEALRRNTYNTVLVVSWGLGPRKEGYGPDNAFARFTPRYPSDDAHLWVRVTAGTTDDHDDSNLGRRYPQVLDVNVMAADHMWNNLADVRAAKSTVGTALLYGGVIATSAGLNSDSDAALYGGLGAMAAGAFLKAGAHVDIRYADVLPQRFYLVPLTLPDHRVDIALQVDGRPGSRLVLTGLQAPAGPDAQLRYVRLLSPANNSPPTWALAGAVLYANPYIEAVPGPTLPYLIGGVAARPPTEAALSDYQRAGHLHGFTLADLRELYRLEHVQWTIEDQAGYAGMHLLEGGRSLVSPLPGTVGFTRVFGQHHPAYQPKTDCVARIIQQSRLRLSTAPPENCP